MGWFKIFSQPFYINLFPKIGNKKDIPSILNENDKQHLFFALS